MVKVSHARCRQCGQARHRNARFNLCGRCWQARKAELQSGWHDIKDRRAAKRNGVAHEEEIVLAVAELPEEEHMPRGRAPSLTPEQEAEIVSLYTTTDQPVTEIARAYGVGDTVPFRVLDKQGVTWRRADTGPKRQLPAHIEAMKEVHVAPTPAPQQSPSIDQAQTKRDDALMGVVPEPPRVMQEALAEAFDKVFPPETPKRLWRVEFSGFREVMAANARDAIEMAETLGATDVTLVRLA